MIENIVQNPIIRGFHPDPNVLKVGMEYYIAVSTFEWLPGNRVFHSTDLITWEYYTDCLTTQVNLQGNPLGGSIWAPQLSYHHGYFYLVYTNVRSTRRPFKDCHNYFMRAKDLRGPWSEPIYLNSSGFDPSIFHDDDGKSWLLNEIWDYRLTTPNKSAGIVLQELILESGELVGPVHKIFAGTERAKTEAPLMYQRNGFYYLVTAEGGTGSGHTITVCRSKNILGPYEVDAAGPLMTAADNPTAPLQCTGHGSLVENQFGQWFIVYLCTRPLEGQYAILGRETAIQEVVWEHDWLRLKNDGHQADLQTKILADNSYPQLLSTDFSDSFQKTLKPEWNAWKNLPTSSWCQVTEQGLKMICGESLQSPFEAHLLAIRQQDFNFEVTTKLDFHASTFNEMAGLVLYLNEENYLYLCQTFDEKLGQVLRILKAEKAEFSLQDSIIAIKNQIELRFVGKHTHGQFFYREDESQGEWQAAGPEQDLRFLSGGFTGNYLGITVQSLDKFAGTSALFKNFNYQGKD